MSIKILNGSRSTFYDLDTAYSNGNIVGRISWDQDNATAQVGLNTNVVLHMGQDDMWYVKNQTGASIPKGSVVYAAGTLGASGRILVAPYIANGTIAGRFILGITAEAIADGADGYVIAKGKLRDFNTNSFTAGTVLWASPTTAGAMTSTEPSAPNIKAEIAFVVHQQTTNGVLAVRRSSGTRLSDDSQVEITSPSTGQLLRYNSNRWENWSPNFLTAEADTLQTVTSRGSSTTTGATFGGNVGIGTSSPSNKLDVIGNILVQGTQGFNAANETASIYIGDTASEIRAVYDGGLDFYQNSTHRMRIQGGTGNVGIGTTVPDTKLQVVGDIKLGNSTSDVKLQIMHGAGSGDYGAIRFYAAGIENNTIHSFPAAWQGGTIYTASAGGINLAGSTTFGVWYQPDIVFPVGGSAYFRNSVGIGTTSPTAPLDTNGVRIGRNFSVSNRATVRLDSNGTSNPADVLFGHTSAANQTSWDGVYWSLSSRASADGNKFYIYRGAGNPDGSGEEVIMALQPNGNVGIGTTTPSAKLEIAATSSTFGLSFANSVPNNPLFINTYGGWSGIGMDQTTAGLRIVGDYSSKLVDVGYYTGGSVSHANWVSRLIVLNTGNVGIGTTSPSAKLHVWNGGIKTTGFPSAGNPFTFLESNYNDAAVTVRFLNINPSNGFDADLGIQLMNTGASMVDVFTIKGSSGNVGIGTTAPEALLHLSKSSAGGEGAFLFIDNPAASTLDNKAGIRFATNAGASFSGYGSFIEAINTNAGNGAESLAFGTWNGAARGERMRITSAGNVGIGTTSPTTKLTVVDGGIEIRDGSSTGLLYKRGTTFDFSIENTGGNLNFFNYGGDERLMILVRSSNRVSIGNNQTPSARLEVQGQGNTSATSALNITNISNTSLFRVRDDAAAIFSGLAGTGTRMVVADANGLLSTQAVSSGTVTGTGTTNYISKFTSGSAIGDSQIFDNGTNVGIGTSSPQKQLEVISSANNFVSIGVSQMSVGAFTGIHFGYRESNNLYRKSAIVFERTDLTSNNAQGKVHILNGPQGNADNATLADAKLTVAENGNIGIGTTSPSDKLTIVGTGSYTGISVDTGSTTGGAYIAMKQNGVSSGFFGGSGAALGDTSTDLAIYAEGGKNIRFYTNGSATERMRITADGSLIVDGRVNIGNGLTRPAALNSDSVAHARIGGADVHLYVASLGAAAGYKVAVQAARTSDFASFDLDLQSNGGTLRYGGTEVVRNTGTWGISITGNAATATSANNIDGVSFVNTDQGTLTNPDTINSNGISYTGANLFGQTDGALYSQAYSSAWQHQIFGDYRTGQIAIRGKNSGTWQAWRTVLDSSNYNSYAPTLTGGGASGTWGISITGNAATVGGYSASQLWRSDGGVWNPTANITLNQSANNQEWSFDITRNGFTGGIWHVWDSSLSSMLVVDATSGKVSAPYNFVGTLEGSASTVGGIAADRIVYGSAGLRQGVVQISDWNQTAFPNAVFLSSENSIPNAPTTDFTYGFQTSFHRGAPEYRTQFVTSLYGNNVYWLRQFRDSAAWSSWVQVIHSGNFNSYAPTLTGGGASGTWGINITGNAATITSQANSATITAAVAPTADTIVLRDGLGDVSAREFVLTAATIHTIAPSSIVGIYPTTNQAVKFGDTAVRAFLNVPTRTGGDASGTWGIDITGNAATATSVPWGNISGHRTLSRDDAGIQGSSGARSGFFEASAPVNYYSGASSWQHMIESRHTNDSNNYAMQIAGSFFDQNFWARKTNNSGTTAWTQLVTNNGGTWGIGISGNAATATSAGNADTVDGFHASVAGTANTIPTRNASGYLIPENWIQLNGIYGLYSPTNDAHLRPNNGSYGSWLVTGSRNSWRGLEFDSGTAGNVSIMISANSNTVGFHNNSYGWQFYWEGGTLYCNKSTYGGGTQATVLDSSNYNSYAPTLTGGGASGTWGINVTGSAGSVAWTNVSGRPTALSSFTNDAGFVSNSLDSFSSVARVISMVTLTAAEYSALSPKLADTLYIVI